MKKHYNITVNGRVQGVGFRWRTREKAEELGVTGYVKNMYDRTVYIEAEAESYVLDIFIEWCKKGPTNARVEDLKYDESPVKGFTHFEIRS